MGNHSCEATGGAGAGYRAYVRLEKGTYNLVVGRGGTGYGNSGEHRGGTGEASTFSKSNTTLISVGGGAGGYTGSSSGPAIGGAGGSISSNTLNEITVFLKASGAGGTTAGKGGTAWAPGGPISGHTWGQTGNSYAGYSGGDISEAHHGYGYLKLICSDPFFETEVAGNYSIQFPLAGKYEVWLVGAGGGGGGLDWHDTDRYGQGGSGGGYIHFTLTVTQNDIDTKTYSLVCGKAGKVGPSSKKAGGRGGDGGKSSFLINGTENFIANGGKGGAGSWTTNPGTSSGGPTGATYSISSSATYTLESDTSNGKNARGCYGAYSSYSTYGGGGNGGSGPKGGQAGYIKIVYKSS